MPTEFRQAPLKAMDNPLFVAWVKGRGQVADKLTASEVDDLHQQFGQLRTIEFPGAGLKLHAVPGGLTAYMRGVSPAGRVADGTPVITPPVVAEPVRGGTPPPPSAKPSCYRIGGIALRFNQPTTCVVHDGMPEIIASGAFAAGRCAVAIDHELTDEIKPWLQCEFGQREDALVFCSDVLPDTVDGWRLLQAFRNRQVMGCSISHAVRADQRANVKHMGEWVSQVNAGSLLAISISTTGRPAFAGTHAMLIDA